MKKQQKIFAGKNISLLKHNSLNIFLFLYFKNIFLINFFG